jgi:hypothetical protein
MTNAKYEANPTQTNTFPLTISHRSRRDVPICSGNFTSLSSGHVAMVSVQCVYLKNARIVSALFALFLIFLSAPRIWSAADGLDASAPDVPAAVPL